MSNLDFEYKDWLCSCGAVNWYWRPCCEVCGLKRTSRFCDKCGEPTECFRRHCVACVQKKLQAARERRSERWAARKQRRAMLDAAQPTKAMQRKMQWDSKLLDAFVSAAKAGRDVL